jgi:Tfp pilus assembly protein PilF
VARAAVKAKQQAKAKSQPAKTARARGRRRHSGGGNPNQQLFFTRLLLAIVFAATFAGVGIGSGTGGLQQLYSGLFGGSGDAVAKAKAEIDKHPAKGWLDLARAYETKSDNTNAIAALHSYLDLRRRDAVVWAELGSLEQSQAQTYATQYQQAQQAAQLADPSAAFQPSGPLATAAGSNPAFSATSQQSTPVITQLYQQATGALKAAVDAYQHAVKIQPHNPSAQLQLAGSAQTAGNTAVALNAYKSYLKLAPHSPQRALVEQQIKQLSKKP